MSGVPTVVIDGTVAAAGSRTSEQLLAALRRSWANLTES
jgi:predicted DsbA family dithiol-disulfide isomerase